MAGLIDLCSGHYRLLLEPARGGSIARFDWRGDPLFRPTCGPSILDSACFALVPFSNRIAHGSFQAGTKEVRLAANFPGGGQPHPLHGFGWLTAWEVVEQSRHHAVLRHSHAAGEWPWAYCAEQRLDLFAAGLEHSLSLRNLSDTAMPAGLGLHPYFPRNAQTRYLGLHRGEWQTGDDGLPIMLKTGDRPKDWWQGQPVGSRIVDTVYTGRDGDLTVVWPDRGLRLTMQPTPNLTCTVLFTPNAAGYFCVEPVSHATDAINRPGTPNPMCWLAPGEVMTAGVRYCAGCS